jgi:hypothetical protein
MDPTSRGFGVEGKGEDLTDFECGVVDVIFLIVDRFATEIFCEGGGVDAAVGYVAVDASVAGALVCEGSETGCAAAVGLSQHKQHLGLAVI